MEIQQPSVVSKGKGKNNNFYDSQKIRGVAHSWAWQERMTVISMHYVKE